MSLHTLANHLQTAGRGEDKVLVHMTPGEVHGLQSLAMAHGGSLTINPETGLPEAGFLSSILPIVAGAALTATGVGAPMAALMVGGAGAAMTGSLSKGLMMGLGAYGGAGLGAGLGLGSAASGASALGSAGTIAAQNAANLGAQATSTLGNTMGAGMAGAGGAGAGAAASQLPIGLQSATGAYAPPGSPLPSPSNFYNVPPTPTAPVVASNIVDPTTGLPIGTPSSAPSVLDRIKGIPGKLGDLLSGSGPEADKAREDFLKQNKNYLLSGGLSALSLSRDDPRAAPPEAATMKFNPNYHSATGQYNAGPMSGKSGERNYSFFADGGFVGQPVERMSQENSVGANTNYPMANSKPFGYAVPKNYPISQNVFQPESFERVDPYTGEQKLADGGLATLHFKSGGAFISKLKAVAAPKKAAPKLTDTKALETSIAGLQKYGGYEEQMGKYNDFTQQIKDRQTDKANKTKEFADRTKSYTADLNRMKTEQAARVKELNTEYTGKITGFNKETTLETANKTKNINAEIASRTKDINTEIANKTKDINAETTSRTNSINSEFASRQKEVAAIKNPQEKASALKDLNSWKSDATKDLNSWKTNALKDFNGWKSGAQAEFNSWKTSATNDLNNYKKDRANELANINKDKTNAINDTASDIKNFTNDYNSFKTEVSAFNKEVDTSIAMAIKDQAAAKQAATFAKDRETKEATFEKIKNTNQSLVDKANEDYENGMSKFNEYQNALKDEQTKWEEDTKRKTTGISSLRAQSAAANISAPTATSADSYNPQYMKDPVTGKLVPYKDVTPASFKKYTKAPGYDTTNRIMDETDINNLFEDVAGRHPTAEEMDKFLGMKTSDAVLASQIMKLPDVAGKTTFSDDDLKDNFKYYTGRDPTKGELANMKKSNLTNFNAVRNYVQSQPAYLDNLNKIGGNLFEKANEQQKREEALTSRNFAPLNANEVATAYKDALGRDPNMDELRKYMGASSTPSDIVKELKSSDEYLASLTKPLVPSLQQGAINQPTQQGAISQAPAVTPIPFTKYAPGTSLSYTPDQQAQTGLGSITGGLAPTATGLQQPSLRGPVTIEGAMPLNPTAQEQLGLQTLFGQIANQAPSLQTGMNFAAPSNSTFGFQPYAAAPQNPASLEQTLAALLAQQKQATPTGMAMGGMADGGYNLGGYSDGGRLLRGPGDGVSDSIPATIGNRQPARLADGEFVIPARIVSELGNGSTDAGARKLYAMMQRIQQARGRTVGNNKVAVNSQAEKLLPA